jgi:hypothetical protein
MWYQLFKDSEEVISRGTLKVGLFTKYEPTKFKDHFGDLTKLWQVGSVRDYQTEFERLLSCVGKLSSQHLLGYFMSGLKETIRTEVQAARPTTLTEAIRLAQLFEAKSWSLKKPPITDSWRPTHGDAVPPLPSTNLTKTRNPQVQRLSTEEMQKRRSRNLCFNCDKKFVSGHHC